MDRREYLLGLLAVFGVGGTAVYLGTREEPARTVEPRRVEILTGSDAGEIRIPATDGLTIVEFFSTYCSGCPEQTAALEPIATEETVAIVSLTTQAVGDELSRADLEAWWTEHGATWPMGIDDGSLAADIGATRLPSVAILDSSGRVLWVEFGASTSMIREQMNTIRNENPSVE